MNELIIPILISSSLILNICFYTGGRVAEFKRWFARTFQTWHIINVEKLDNKNNVGENFILFTAFINLLLTSSKNDNITEKCPITINNTGYLTIKSGDCLEIKLNITKERMKELNLSKQELSFWIIANGHGTEKSPNGYELWISYKNEISDVYRVLTLFLRDQSKCAISMINFSNMFRISNDIIRNLTYNDIINHSIKSINTDLKDSVERVSNYNFSLINNEESSMIIQSNKFQIQNKIFVNQFNFLNTQFIESNSVIDKDKVYTGIVMQNYDKLFSKNLNRFELINYLNILKIFFNDNQDAYKVISSFICLANFKSFIEMKIRDEALDDNSLIIEAINSNTDLGSILKNIRQKEFFIKILNDHSKFNLLSNVIFIFYLKLQINNNLDINNFIETFFEQNPVQFNNKDGENINFQFNLKENKEEIIEIIDDNNNSEHEIINNNSNSELVSLIHKKNE